MKNADHNIWDGNVAKSELELSNPAKTVNAAFDIDFKRILGLWPFILLFGLIGYSVGVIYLRYITPIYTISTSISLEDKQDISLGQVLLGSNKDPLNDQIAYFKSPTLAAQLIDSLGLNYHSESQGRFKNKDYYGIIRWQILTGSEEEVPAINFSILPIKNGFKFISGSFSLIKQSIPTFCNPTEFIIPPSTSVTLGVGFPSFGLRLSPFVTKAPMASFCIKSYSSP